ncbi:MAG: Ppx/GppA family phosphatase [Zetaproteobacteria bacterium]|nr:Ppx/GppA family phosphatase [Zetaproteobacteria bacterium]
MAGRRYASIDIGTNTVRLLIADLENNGTLTPVTVERVVTRLGGGYTEESGIASDAIERTVNALKGFADSIKRHGVDDIDAVATSVVRRARNGVDFTGRVRERTGIDVAVIDGGEEARLSTLGVLSILDDRKGRSFIIDIGGGSTEFIAVDGGDVAGTWSMEMGVVHLTERFLRHDPPEEGELMEMEGAITGTLKTLKGAIKEDGIDSHLYSGYSGIGKSRFIGTAGTVTTIAAIDQDLTSYTPESVNNYRIDRGKIEWHYHHLASMTLEERRAIPALEEGREDLIIAGTAILIETMKAFKFDETIVSDSGLLEGILLDRSMSRGMAS